MKMSIHIKLVIIAWFAVASTVTFTSSVQAACDPKIASIAADPYTISKSSPTTKIIVEVSGVDTCIRGSLNGVEVYAEAIGTSSKLATWSLGLFVESNPGQPIYRLERIP